MELMNKIQVLCDTITNDQKIELGAKGFTYAHHVHNHCASFRVGKKYIAIDIGHGSRYMVDKVTGVIYWTKAYNQIHKGYVFGTLDTVSQWFWGEYKAYKKVGL